MIDTTGLDPAASARAVREALGREPEVVIDAVGATPTLQTGLSAAARRAAGRNERASPGTPPLPAATNAGSRAAGARGHPARRQRLTAAPGLARAGAGASRLWGWARRTASAWTSAPPTPARLTSSASSGACGGGGGANPEPPTTRANNLCRPHQPSLLTLSLFAARLVARYCNTYPVALDLVSRRTADIRKIVTQRFPFTAEGVAAGFACAAGHAVPHSQRHHGPPGLVVKVMFEMQPGEHHVGEL